MGGVLWRGLIYLLVAVALAELLRLEAVYLGPGRMFSERGYVEWLQSACLAATTAVLLFRARVTPAFRQLAVCMAVAFLILLIRENDQNFELFLPDGSWKFVAAGPALFVGAYFLRHRAAVGRQLAAWSRDASFGVMLSAFFALVFVRLFGSARIWEVVLEGEMQVATVKTVVQEGSELMCLALMLMAAIEFTWFGANAVGRRKNDPQRP